MQAWRPCSHTAIHLSLHSSNKCHLYTEATHISLLADIIDACLSGYIYWIIATASVSRVRSNNKSWWWPSDTLNSQRHFEIQENYFHWFGRTVYYTYHGVNVLKMWSFSTFTPANMISREPFCEKSPSLHNSWQRELVKWRKEKQFLICCELLS